MRASRSMPVVVLVLALVFLTAASALAQDAPKIGLTAGYPSAIGVLWQLSDHVAVRPEIDFNRSTMEFPISTPAGTSSSSSSSGLAVGTGVTVLMYGRRVDGFRPYAGPQFRFSRDRDSFDHTILGATTRTETTTETWLVGGLVGGQYSFGRRFGIFGDAGFSYSRVQSRGQTTAGFGASWRRTSSSGLATRTAVGIILGF